MPPHSSADTPVMRQYMEVKERYPDCIVFFQLGDFYEMFFDDALWVSRALDLTLTSRDRNKEEGVPMCGVPLHAAKFYIGKLIELGKKVALCDQVEDARLTKKIVRRAVTQVVTPGVVLEEEQLSPKAGHYLCALAPGQGPATGQVGLCYLDVSTGEFAATQLREGDLLEEISRIEPAEILIVGDREEQAAFAAQLTRRLRVPVGHSPPGKGEEDRALLLLALGDELSDIDDPERSPRLSEWPFCEQAAAACLRYARGTQPEGTLPISRLRLYRHGDEMVIDEATKVNLELFQTLMERKPQGALWGLLDHTRTAMGGRLLRRWLGAPLLQVAGIRRRHDAVEWLVERHTLRTALRAQLQEIHDMERLTGRITLGVASPRDLFSLQKGLERLPEVRRLLHAGAETSGAEAVLSPLPDLLCLGDDLCADVAAAIAGAIVDDPPASWREGGFIRRGFHAELDELLDISQGGKEQILRIEQRERERTGISSLKVRYNSVFGYFLEITRSNLSRVPADYVRKQTLANAERYVTPELSEYEAKVLGAEERRVQLEMDLFGKLREQLLGDKERLLLLAGRVAQLDALAGLGELAHMRGFVRPEMTDGQRMVIEDGRHPVVEQLCPSGQFVPNDTTLDPDDAQLIIITGPNMAGKSTAMRQVALISILSQMGSFVPARRAQLCVVDRVFTRVGASDNLARGESTFMVEMRETSHILQHASRRSLVVLDEIGRGTSTYDGVSIAWAVAEYLHDVIGCKTMFATHYHELCALAESRPRVRNLSVAVREWQGEIVFLHKLIEGGASRSYGIEVARLAGLPRGVVDRSREILHALETGAQDAALPVHGTPPVTRQQLALFHGPETGAETDVAGQRRRRGRAAVAAVAERTGVEKKDPRERAVLERLRQMDCDGMTPRDALSMVAALCEQLR